MVGHCDSRYKRIQPLSNCQLSFGGKRKYYRIEDRCLAIPTPVPQHDKMQAFFFFFFLPILLCRGDRGLTAMKEQTPATGT